eukprot:7431225-Pyramimonas_sp.AAC.1
MAELCPATGARASPGALRELERQGDADAPPAPAPVTAAAPAPAGKPRGRPQATGAPKRAAGTQTAA